jgi:hypothetical protein
MGRERHGNNSTCDRLRCLGDFKCQENKEIFVTDHWHFTVNMRSGGERWNGRAGKETFTQISFCMKS